MRHFTCIILCLLLGCVVPEKEGGQSADSKKESPGFVAAKKAFEAGKYKEAIKLLEGELAAEKKKAKPDLLRRSLVHFQLGENYNKNYSDDKALEHHQKALDIRLKQLGTDHHDVAASYSSIGAAYGNKGEIDKALGFYQRSLAIFVKTKGPNHPKVADSYRSIGLVHYFKGEYDKALENYQKALAIQLKKLGVNHPDVATSYSRIGLVHDNKGEYDKALEYYRKALAIQLKELGADHPDVARSYNHIGGVYNNKSEYGEALEYFGKSLAIRLRLKNQGENYHYIEAASDYTSIGWVHNAKGEYDKAIESHNGALSIRLEHLGPDHPKVALGFWSLGEVYSNKGTYDKALRFYQKSLSIVLKTPVRNHSLITSTYSKIGLVYERMAEPDQALEYCRKAMAMDLKQIGPDHPDMAHHYTAVGLAYYRKGLYDKALEFARKSLALGRKKFGPDHLNLGGDYLNIGVMHRRKGEYGEALESYHKGLAIFLKRLGPNHRNVASCYINIGALHGLMGDYGRALEFDLKSLPMLLKQLGPDHPDVALSYNNIGITYNNKGEYDKALEFANKALAIWLKQLGADHPSVAESYNNIAYSHNEMGEYDKARGYFQKSLEIKLKRLGPKHPDVGLCYNNIGTVHYEKVEYDKALEYYQKARGIFFKQLGPDHPRVGYNYNSIGLMHHEKGEYDKALEFYQKGLAIRLKKLGVDHPDVALSYNSIGITYNSKGEYDKALENSQKGLAIRLKKLGADHPYVATSHLDVGYAQYGLKSVAGALAAGRKAQAIQDKRLGYMLSFTSERERLAYQKQQNPFNLLGTLGSAPDLAESILHNKGIVLSSLLEDQLAAQASSDPKIKELAINLRVASRQLNKLEMENPKDTSEKGWKAHRAKQEAARTKAEALQKQLARTVTGFGKARASLSLTIKDVQGRLAKDAALVEYITYSYYQGKDQEEWRIGAIVLPKRGEPKWVPLGPAEEIGKLLSKYSPLKPTDDEAYEEVLRGLHDKLMAPVVKQLPEGTKTLILCPDGSLNFLSFATFLTEKDTFLCEEYTLKYVSSGRDMVKEFTPSKGSLAVYANPTYTGEPVQLAGTNGAGVTLRSVDRDELRGSLQFKALPGTQKEADYLKDKTTDWKLKPEIHVGKEATEAAISQVKNPYILHLATHGFFLPDPEGVRKKQTPVGMQLGGEQKYRGRLINPMHRSGLAFTGAQKTLDAWAKGETPPTHNDGILTAAEASVLDLKGTWLVTLSACETGRGEARSGEGVLGLRRAFIQAGAQNLLMTLWPVDDKQTIPFMKEFYERAMADGNAPESLAEVQTERLVKLRDVLGTRLAVQFAGPFIMSFQGAK